MCTSFLALSLVEAGYTVYANADASGTFDVRTASDANDRMRTAGVHVLSMFAVACELMRDWRSTPGATHQEKKTPPLSARETREQPEPSETSPPFSSLCGCSASARECSGSFPEQIQLHRSCPISLAFRTHTMYE